jgi:hypothetical protein
MEFQEEKRQRERQEVGLSLTIVLRYRMYQNFYPIGSSDRILPDFVAILRAGCSGTLLGFLSSLNEMIV